LEAFAISTFSIAIGELGDKTQLLSLVLAARLRKPLPIIVGILVATFANHVIACSVGRWAAALIYPETLRWVLGISFLAVAVWALFPDRAEEGQTVRSSYGAFVITVVAFFWAEMGDKTQIAALALAAKYDDLVAVVGGTTLGMMIVNVPTVLLAQQVTSRIPIRPIRIAAAVVYALLGVVTLAGHAGR
jgi:Ca2+/H+ antiporter, TMEM165/GDT1 family